MYQNKRVRVWLKVPCDESDEVVDDVDYEEYEVHLGDEVVANVAPFLGDGEDRDVARDEVHGDYADHAFDDQGVMSWQQTASKSRVLSAST